MRNRLLPALPALLLTLAPGASAAQTTLQLRWELVGDSVANDWGASRVAFTLTNRSTKPLTSSGWAIYFNALHSALPGSVGSGFIIEDVIADLHRLAPAAGFAGLAPGASIRIPYLTGLLLNRSFVPQGPYIVFDEAKDVGVPLNDYVALPFERPPQGAGHDPRVVTPENQFALDSATRPIPASELPQVFPTPVEVTRGTGALHLATLPPVEAAEALKAEAAFAAEYLRPYFGSTRKAGGPTVRLEVGPVAGQASPEAYTLLVDSVQGVRIVGVSPAGVFYGLQSLRSLLPAPTPRAGLVLPAIRVVDAPRFGYRGFMLDVARNFHPKPAVLRTLDLIARYKLNVFHLHLTDDEGWRIEIPGLPELTAVGGRRGHPPDSDRHLPPAFGSGPAVDRPWGSGFLSRADYVEILRYAAARHIEVIPELEMPGHARAAIRAMQANPQYRLNDPDDRSVYTSAQGYHDNVMNPVLESTYRFIERVVGDLVTMHREAGVPLRHIHMGGDEVPGGVWQGSPAVQAYLKAHDLTSVDELWFIFYGRVAQMQDAGGGPPALGLGGDRGTEDPARRATDEHSQSRLRRARLARLRLEQRPRRGRRGPRLPPRERRLRRGLESREQSLLRSRLERESGRDGARLGRLRGSPQAVRFHPVRLLPQRAGRCLRVRRQGSAHRLRSGPHCGDSGQPVVGDAGRRGATRVHDAAEVVRPGRKGVGARPGLGQGARPREVRVPVPRGLVPLRQRAWPARAAPARSGGRGGQLPDPHARSQGRRRRGLLQPGATGLRPALHDRRQRAHCAQRRSPRSDPVPRD